MIHGSNVIDTSRVSKDLKFHKRSLHPLTTKPIGMDRVRFKAEIGYAKANLQSDLATKESEENVLILKPVSNAWNSINFTPNNVA